MLNIWVIYQSPRDYPGRFVARRWILDKPTGEVIVRDTLDQVRRALPVGLHRMDRFNGDDAAIVETWF